MNVSKTILLAAAGLSALFLVSAQSAAGRGHMGSGPGHILETCSVEFECAEYSNGALSNCLILSDNCEVTYPGDKAHIINLTAENELNGGRMSGGKKSLGFYQSICAFTARCSQVIPRTDKDKDAFNLLDCQVVISDGSNCDLFVGDFLDVALKDQGYKGY